MIKLVLIDIDETLILSQRVVFPIENEVAVDMGFAPMTRETHLKSWGVPLREAIMERVPGVNPDEFMERLRAKIAPLVARNEFDVVPEETHKTLATLRASGKKLGILTSREAGEMEHLMDPKHELSKTIERFYHKDNSEFIKPDPRVFAKPLADFGVSPEEAIYIGDTVNDGICAKAAGLHFIALLEGGLRTKEAFAGVPVDYFANTFPDVLDYIERK